MPPNVAAVLAALMDAITQYDVGATIQDDDVDKWNCVTRAKRELQATLEQNGLLKQEPGP